jgi:peptide/nickel transport system substrate-binding protein
MKRVAAAALALACLASPAWAAKDSITLGMPLEPPVLDPTASAAAAVKEVTYGNIFQGLARITEHGEVAPLLAKSWTISPDGLTYSFALQTGVTFHDGAPFDCSTVKFTYERAAGPDSTNSQKAFFEPIASIACPDPATAIITLKRPTGLFLNNMASGDASMLSPTSVAGNKTNPIGTGPFVFKRWIKGDRVELERNPHYWGTPVKLASATFRFISDPSAATAAILAGDLDAFPLFPSPESLDTIRKDPRFAVVVGTTQGKTIMSINEARKPFDDVRVRRALAYAIDRNALIDALGGLGKPIGSHFIPGNPGYVDLVGAYPYDPEKAQKLLAEAGVKPGTEMTIKLPPPGYARRGGEVIAAMLEQVGIKAKLVPVEWAQWLDQVYKQSDFDLTIIAHVEPNDLEIYARDKYYFNYNNAAYKALYQKYVETTENTARLGLLGDLQRKLSEDEANVFLFALPKVGVWNAKLTGLWHDQPIFANDLSNVAWSD